MQNSLYQITQFLGNIQLLKMMKEDDKNIVQGIPVIQNIYEGTPVYQSNNEYNFANLAEHDLVYTGIVFHKLGVNWQQRQQTLTFSSLFGKHKLNNITKVKIYGNKSTVANTYQLKIVEGEKEYIYAIPFQNGSKWFYNIIWARLALIDINSDREQEFINVCAGDILKKSQFLENWEQRYVLITPKDGLLSYRDRKQPPTLQVVSTNQLWTRFTLVRGKSYLVIKLMNGFLKHQFGIPANQATKWLKAFYSLLRI